MTDDVLASFRAMYDRLAEFTPPEPIKLTQPQWDWLKTQVETKPAPGWDFGGMVSPLFGVPVHIVATFEDSTPYLEGWPGWRVAGHSDAPVPPSSASVAPQPEETE